MEAAAARKEWRAVPDAPLRTNGAEVALLLRALRTTKPLTPPPSASRAASGRPIYISDSVGSHDFKLLRRLALPDGTILRCDHYALPTRDCFFRDPLHDGQTMLKIWNLNKFSGVLGVFNCQGGGWSPEARRNTCASQFSVPVTAHARPSDIEWRSDKNPISVKGVSQFAMYFVEAKKLELLLLEEGKNLLF